MRNPARTASTVRRADGRPRPRRLRRRLRRRPEGLASAATSTSSSRATTSPRRRASSRCRPAPATRSPTSPGVARRLAAVRRPRPGRRPQPSTRVTDTIERRRPRAVRTRLPLPMERRRYRRPDRRLPARRRAHRGAVRARPTASSSATTSPSRRRPAAGDAARRRRLRRPADPAGRRRRRSRRSARSRRSRTRSRSIVKTAPTGRTAAASGRVAQRVAGRVPGGRGADRTPSTATTIDGPLDQMVEHALRAAGHERRHLAVRDRQQPLPRRSTSARASSACCARSARPALRSGAIVRYESVITAVDRRCARHRRSASFFAWLDDAGARRPRPRVRVPVAQLGLFLVLAVLVGIVGAVIPARRGARIDVLEALRYE